MAMSAAEPSAALPKCGDMGVGHGNLERLHQLVCIISYMVSVLSEGQGKGGGLEESDPPHLCFRHTR